MKPSYCPKPNAVLIWDISADFELVESDDESLPLAALESEKAE